MNLHGHGVGHADLVPPVAPAHGNEGHLGCDDAASD
eukprot:CAMPEP_0185905670 /NCGR_PEP_ID=MMETSP0196C-20130402/4859_1 /TAXON_ID=2932 /ORGANISM="Alexandrium fundyense, Strain CCMP1719" /LENGTH=35 /DNA_ID= /DNA_START= /DNA_END= /DNA_ORIENTATION=